MNCHETRRHWELYYDSEGDSELYLRINDHLADCPECAKWFFQQGQFEDAVARKLAGVEPTAELWQRVLGETSAARPMAGRGWLLLGACFAVAASLLLLTASWWTRADRPPDHLAALTAVAHRGFVEHSKPIDFRSESDLAVEQYLKTRVSFPVRCPPRQDAGFAVRGGGVCTIGGSAAAYVVGQIDGKDVSVFILPVERLVQFAHERDVLAREAVHHCREGDYDMVLARVDSNLVVVIGSGTPQQLERVVRAYGTYHEMPMQEAA